MQATTTMAILVHLFYSYPFHARSFCLVRPVLIPLSVPVPYPTIGTLGVASTVFRLHITLVLANPNRFVVPSWFIQISLPACLPPARRSIRLRQVSQPLDPHPAFVRATPRTTVHSDPLGNNARNTRGVGCILPISDMYQGSPTFWEHVR